MNPSTLSDTALDRYLAKLGYDGARVATLEVLRALHRLHPLAIPFENLDPLAGRGVSIALDDIVAKLVDARRGGYCFEHNTLFAHVLMRLGFHVTLLEARVLWGGASDTVMPRTHMLLRVDLDGDAWLADVGFGGVTLCVPLAFGTRDAQPTPLEAARLEPLKDGGWKLAVRDGDGWADVYRFAPTSVEWIDYEVANWYTSASPASFFTSSLIACAVKPDGRAILFDDHYTERDGTGRSTSTRLIGSPDELAACLNGSFGIDLTGFDMEALFARVAGQGAR